MRVLFVGGGSVGHIAPALAVWQELHAMHPDIEADFVCGSGEAEQQFLRRENIHFEAINAPRLGLGLAFGMLKALNQSKEIITKLRPDVVFSKGSYVSVPMCLAAWTLGIPIVLHESDAVMGRANRLIAKLAGHVCLGFATTKNQKLKTHQTVTGNPIRQSVTQGSREEGLRTTGFSGKRPILLVVGGSQGAKALNEIVATKLDELLQFVDVIHITGHGKKTGNRKSVSARPSRDGQETGKRYFMTEFAYDELPNFYAAADIALSRAGAGSIAELEECGIPTILVPLQGVGHDHQYVNAQCTAKRNPLFVHLEQRELSEKMIPTLQSVLKCRKERGTAGDTARHIAQILLNTLEETRVHQ